MSNVNAVNSQTFFKHHHHFLKTWESKPNEFDAIAICNGEDGDNKFKTTAMNIWYFGYDFL